MSTPDFSASVQDDHARRLRRHIEELQVTYAAIRREGVDAVVASGPTGEQLFTLTSTDLPYRMIVEQMGEGAATISEQGVILFVNQSLAEMLKRDRHVLVGHDIRSLATGPMARRLTKLVRAGVAATVRDELELTRADGSSVPVLISVTGLDIEGVPVRCLMVSDLTAVKQSQRRLIIAERRAARNEQQRAIAEELQRSLLPEALPQLPRLRLAGAYQPAGHALAIGGDWYDAVMLDPHIALVIGDVAGHGINAAVVMGRLRTALQAYLLDGLGPAAALTKLNRIVNTLEPNAFATVALVIVDPASGEFRYATAGHPAPLQRDANGCVSRLDGASCPALGIVRNAEFREATATVQADGALLLYTDGLVERPDRPLNEAIEILAHAFAASIVNANSHVELMLQTATTQLGSLRRDDVALLVAHRPPLYEPESTDQAR